MGDHPRGCGAHPCALKKCLYVQGSSPRVRGSQGCLWRDYPPSGIIPAGAGLTSPAGHAGCSVWDHPRGCGAHQTFAIHHLSTGGSSPRVRGSRRSIIAAMTTVGIIPAGAGLTILPPLIPCIFRDHPRGCGAHILDIIDENTIKGSSPRVRGSRDQAKIIWSEAGIIPAGAGLTPSYPRQKHATRDHPRGCGAHQREPFGDYQGSGSSPRVRGSLSTDFRSKTCKGIIPAGAGLTFAFGRGAASTGDHPRGCGAHSVYVLQGDISKGSSPRVRGSPFRPVVLESVPGIIPAGAGLTDADQHQPALVRDHPRGCGAHSRSLSTAVTSQGSSPRVRGSPPDGRQRQV